MAVSLETIRYRLFIVASPYPPKRQADFVPEKSPRRIKLEQSLADEPSDTFLRYGLAMQCLREGDVAEGRDRLKALIADHPEDQVAAYQQLGQSYMESGELDSARETFHRGISKARARGDGHAAAEMEGFLSTLG